MKRVYFIRHGLTRANVEGTVQGLDDPLTEKGEAQALRLAERAKNIEFDALISSDAVRAQKTAAAIVDVKGMNIELSPLFREAKRPTSLVGTSWDTGAYAEFCKLEEAHWGEEGWRFEDEENYDDLRKRAQEGVAFIEAHEKDTLMVVSHGRFMRYLIGEIMLGEEMTPAVMRKIDGAFRTFNTGITVCYQADEGGVVEWKILTWNDHAHFADSE